MMEILLLLILALIALAVSYQEFTRQTRRPPSSSGNFRIREMGLNTNKKTEQGPDFLTWLLQSKRVRRRNYYRNVYLKSEEWQRKRYVVLKRDNWTCVYCGGRATQVHHKRYAKWNIGKEPIDWLVSICKTCHEARHR